MNVLRGYRLWLLAGLWLISAVATWWFVPLVPKLEAAGRPAGFSDDGTMFAVLQDDGRASFYDVESGKEVLADRRRQLAGKLSGLNFPCASDGRVWVQQQVDQWGAATLTIWDIATAKKLATLKQDRNNRHFSISPDGKRLASGCTQLGTQFGGAGEVKIWDVDSGEEQLAFTPGSDASRIRFGPLGETLIVSSNLMYQADFNTLWDVSQTPPRALFDGNHPLGRLTSDISPNGKLLARPFEVLSLHTLEQQSKFAMHDRVYRLVFSPDGARLAATSSDPIRSTMNMIDAPTGKRICSEWRLPAGFVEELEFAPDGNTIMTASNFLRASLCSDAAHVNGVPMR